MNKINIQQFLSENYVSQRDRFIVSKMNQEVLRTSAEWYNFLKCSIDLSKVADKYESKVTVNTTAQTSIIEPEVKEVVSEVIDSLKNKNK